MKNSFIEEILYRAWVEIGTDLININEPRVIRHISEIASDLYGKEVGDYLYTQLSEQGTPPKPPTTPPAQPDGEEDKPEKDVEVIEFGMMTAAEKEEYLKKKKMGLEEDTWVKNKKSGSVYTVKKHNPETQDIASEEDIETAKTKRTTSKEKLEKGEFDAEENKQSMDSFIEIGFGDSEGAPGSPGSMLNEIASIKSATDSFNSKKGFDFDSQLESNINMLKGSGLGAENDGDTPPAGITMKEARVIAEKYGISIGLAGKCIIATRAAQSKHNHITERIAKLNGLENPKATPFFGDKNGLKAQENMINSATGRIMLGNTEVSKEEAIKIIKSGGGGNNPSDTAIFITDEKTGDVYMTFYSDKDNVNAIVAQSSLRAEGEVKKGRVRKLVEDGKITKEQADKLESAIDKSVKEHEEYEAELSNITKGPSNHLLKQNPNELVDIAKNASKGGNSDKYWKEAVVNQILGKKPNKAILAELPEGHSNPPTESEMMVAFVKYTNNSEVKLTKSQQRLISDMNKATDGPKIGSAIGEIRKKTIQSDMKMLQELNKESIELDDGSTVGMGTYLEAESVKEKLHLEMLFGGEGVFSDPDAFYQESGGVKVNKNTLSKCIPALNENDYISTFEVSEEREITQRGSDVITGGSKIIYAITKEGERFPIGEKKQRSKGGDLGKLSTVYNYSPEIQKCFKKNG